MAVDLSTWMQDMSLFQNSFLVILILAIASAPLGLFLHLRGLSLATDALSHSILPGAALAYFLFGLELIPMSLGGLAVGLLVFFAAASLHQISHYREDSMLSVAHLFSMSVGVLIISLKRSQLDLLHFLFGNPLAVTDQSLIFSAVVAMGVLLALWSFGRGLLLVYVDEDFAEVLGLPIRRYHFLFLFLVGVQLVLGYQALGSILSIGLILLPSLIARLFVRHWKWQVILSMVFAAVLSCLGFLGSLIFNLPPGPSIIALMGACFLCFFGFQVLARRWI